MTHPAGSTTSAPPTEPRRALRVVDLAWQLPLVVVLGAAAASYLVDDPASSDQALVRLSLAGCAVAAYLVLRRWAVWSWLAALAVAPALVGSGLVDLAGGAAARGSVCLVVAVTVGLTVAGWRSLPTAVAVAVVVVAAAAGLVARSVVGTGDPARVSWSSASTFFVLALPAAIGLFASVGLARASGSPALRLLCGLVVLAPLVVLLAAQVDAASALVWWPAGGALGLTALLRGRRGTDVDRPQSDDVDEAALAAFARAHGRPALAPVTVVIAAYNEAEGIAQVVARLPEQICSLRADIVVVDDGSTDGTAETARRALADLGRGYVVACPTNRGQGAALRLGYRVAREHGTSFIVTTDADGQYDVSDLAVVLRPVIDGRADFVTGSRRLGALFNRDRVRQLGTYVFALLASVLGGRWHTDTSFGLRAMRPEVTAEVTLNQPQYQASELLLGAASHGFRVLEVPGTMRRRGAGASKKGRNLVYGYRYGRVMLGTWWREGAPRPVIETARALRAGREATRGQ